MDPSLKKFEEDLKLGGLRPNTISTYLSCGRRLAKRFGRPVAELSASEVRSFLLEMAERKAPARTRNVYLAAVRSLYGRTLGRPEVAADLRRAKVPRTAVEILSGSETEQLFAAVKSPKYRALFLIAYAAGLRVSEACALRTDDIDSRRMLIRVREGKTGQRYVMLSPRALKGLRDYWRAVRPPGPELFPGRRPGKVLTPNTVRKALVQIVRDAQISKRVTPHTLRHCFATHLLDLGTDLRTVQVLLGHASLNSTCNYLHLTRAHFSRIQSPMDVLGTPRAKSLG
jgi:integrase/recombinase XerD